MAKARRSFWPLTIFPLIYRDLSRALRHRRAASKRLLAAAIPVGAGILLLCISLEADPRKIGLFLFFVLFGFGLFQATTAPSELSTELFAEERRNGTLGFLYLAGLNSIEIFLGKLTGGLMIGFNRLLALIPCLLLPFVMRAIPWTGFVAALETLFCWALFCLSARIFASSLFKDESASRIFSEACLLALGGGVLALNAVNTLLTGMPLDPRWLILSPAYAPWLLFKGFGVVNSVELHATNLFTFVLAAVLILASGSILQRSWQEQTFGAMGGNMPLRAWIGGLLRTRRQRLRHRWLDSAPYAWLAARLPNAFLHSWLTLGAILCAWAIGLWHWAQYWMVPVNFWATALVIAAAVHWTIHYSAARQIAEDRSTGALELLLTSALTPEEIVNGQEKIIRRHARPLFYAVAAVNVIFFVLGGLGRTWSFQAWCNYCLIWVAVAAVGPWAHRENIWATFWISLNTGRSAFALRKYLWQGGGLLSGVVQMVIHANKLIHIPYGNWLETTVAGLVAAGLIASLFIQRRSTSGKALREKILSDLREIASEPVPDPADPRLKSWDVSKRFFKEEPEKIVV